MIHVILKDGQNKQIGDGFWPTQSRAEEWAATQSGTPEYVNIPKTVEEAMAEGEARLSWQGFPDTVQKILLAVAPTLPSDKLAKYHANMNVVLAMFQAARTSPADFNAQDYSLPHDLGEII